MYNSCVILHYESEKKEVKLHSQLPRINYIQDSASLRKKYTKFASLNAYTHFLNG